MTLRGVSKSTGKVKFGKNSDMFFQLFWGEAVARPTRDQGWSPIGGHEGKRGPSRGLTQYEISTVDLPNERRHFYHAGFRQPKRLTFCGMGGVAGGVGARAQARDGLPSQTQSRLFASTLQF